MIVDGIDLHVEVDGAGPDLLLVNGAFCTVRQWDLVVGALTDRYRVIRLDVRGTGRSAAGPRHGYTFERYADDIEAIAHQVGADTISIWGMAWGARVALVAAARHPGLVRRVVLSDLSIEPADTDAQRRGAAVAKAERAAAGIPEAPEPAGWCDHNDIDEARRALAATLLHPDLYGVAEAVGQPTLICTGEHDPNLASSRRALGALTEGRLEVLRSTGHGSVLQRPDLVVGLVLDFLDEPPGRGEPTEAAGVNRRRRPRS